MRKLIFMTMISLDGLMEGPGHSLDWAVIDEELHRFVNAHENQLGGYLYGRRMYETMQAAWPEIDRDPEAADFMREFAHIWVNIPKTVFSKTLQQVEGNARLVRDDPAAEVARLKAQPGKDLEVGGVQLASYLLRQGLVDELHIYIHPVILGKGTRVVEDLANPVRLRLIDTHRFHSGVVRFQYQIQ